MSTGALVVISTFKDSESASRVAKSLIEESLAACAQVSSEVLSLYQWKSEFQSDKEVQLWLKTSKKTYPKLEARLKELHPYELPQVIALEISEASHEYLNWVNSALKP